jgi:hypothetical protein
MFNFKKKIMRDSQRVPHLKKMKRRSLSKKKEKCCSLYCANAHKHKNTFCILSCSEFSVAFVGVVPAVVVDDDDDVVVEVAEVLHLSG